MGKRVSRDQKKQRSKYARANGYADAWLDAQSKDRLYTIQSLWSDIRKAWLDGHREALKPEKQ